MGKSMAVIHAYGTLELNHSCLHKVETPGTQQQQDGSSRIAWLLARMHHEIGQHCLTAGIVLQSLVVLWPPPSLVTCLRAFGAALGLERRMTAFHNICLHSAAVQRSDLTGGSAGSLKAACTQLQEALGRMRAACRLAAEILEMAGGLVKVSMAHDQGQNAFHFISMAHEYVNSNCLFPLDKSVSALASHSYQPHLSRQLLSASLLLTSFTMNLSQQCKALVPQSSRTICAVSLLHHCNLCAC